MIKNIHHVSVLVTDLQRSVDFYSNVLGLELSTNRPNLDFDGAWFELGPQQLHLICQEEVHDTDSGRRCSRDRHLALAVDNISRLKDQLRSAGIPFDASKSGRAAIFCRDPDGNGLEFISDN